MDQLVQLSKLHIVGANNFFCSAARWFSCTIALFTPNWACSVSVLISTIALAEVLTLLSLIDCFLTECMYIRNNYMRCLVMVGCDETCSRMA